MAVATGSIVVDIFVAGGGMFALLLLWAFIEGNRYDDGKPPLWPWGVNLFCGKDDSERKAD